MELAQMQETLENMTSVQIDKMPLMDQIAYIEALNTFCETVQPILLRNMMKTPEEEKAHTFLMRL